MINIYEFDHTVQPGALADHFEAYLDEDVLTPIFVSDSLDKTVRFCYDSGHNFTVHTIQAYYNEFGEE